jgi:hypothetical protein
LTDRSAAYNLFNESICSPGAKWDTAKPVKVRLLVDSFVDYWQQKKLDNPAAGLVDLVEDIEAVIAEYNAISGIDLVLEADTHLFDDDNLDPYAIDDFENQTIVIGFTDADATDPAWASHHPNDVCTYTESHIYFRKFRAEEKDNRWVLGAPTTTDVNGKDLPDGISFRALLLHEMGHAVGLAHPETGYAVMDHGTKAWTRGPKDMPQMELLPDDIKGLRALYGNGGANNFDVSLTNTWYLSAEERTQFNAKHNIRHTGCDSIEDALVDLRAKRQDVLDALPSLQGPGLQFALESLENIDTDIAGEEDNLWECRYRENEAAQIQNCKVSSRGDAYAPREDEVVYCGVNLTPSAFDEVGTLVCPGHHLQLRYTINNKSDQTLDIEEQVWLSVDAALEVSGAAADLKSPDTRQWRIDPEDSVSIGRVFRVPATAPDGNYRVYARAVPYSTATGLSLWSQDEDQWNNSILVRSWIVVNAAVCP